MFHTFSRRSLARILGGSAAALSFPSLAAMLHSITGMRTFTSQVFSGL